MQDYQEYFSVSALTVCTVGDYATHLYVYREREKVVWVDENVHNVVDAPYIMLPLGGTRNRRGLWAYIYLLCHWHTKPLLLARHLKRCQFFLH